MKFSCRPIQLLDATNETLDGFHLYNCSEVTRLHSTLLKMGRYTVAQQRVTIGTRQYILLSKLSECTN